MQLTNNQKVYFASDFHLGIPSHEESLKREKRLCQWLDQIKHDAAHLYLLGDLFDAWMEYKNVVPKGYIRFLGKLAELRDAGIAIDIFSGNHDIWMLNYFQKELGIAVHHNIQHLEINNKKFLIGHGDGLGPGDHGYKFLKSILRNPICQWLYRRVHPDTGIAILNYFSQLGPKHVATEKDSFKGADKEFLVQYCLDQLQKEAIDYFIFGHRHLALEYPLNDKSLYINLGDWVHYNSYAVFDGTHLSLKYFTN